MDPNPNLSNDAKHWRFRAEEMRAAAEAMNDEMCRAMALRIAEDYERLAVLAEQRSAPSATT